MSQDMQKTRFVIVRHGETQWNRDEREMGQLDIPMTAHGLATAERLAARISKVRFDAIYSSDLSRAAHTAGVIAARCSLAIILDARLRERNMGIFQGLTKQEMEERYPDERAAYRRIGASYVIPNGESADQRLARTLECLEEIAHTYSGGSVVVVTHGGILKGFFEHVLGLPFGSGAKFSRPNVAWNLFVHDRDRWRMETWGDVSHLSTGVCE